MNWGKVTVDNEPTYEKWAVKELATPYYGHVAGDTAKALTLPKYQRNFVWTDKKRKELVHSIRNGFPIGTLIVRKTSKTTKIPRDSVGVVEAETYELLDGLQRSTTLLLNRLNFLELIASEDVDLILNEISVPASKLQELILSLSKSGSKKALTEVIAVWMQSCHIMKKYTPDEENRIEYKVPVFDDTKFQTSEMVDAIADAFEVNSGELRASLTEAGLWEKLLKVPSKTKSLFDISEKTIPVIVWEGNDQGAAHIFERVNQGGVKLNRYQALAASWYSSITDITSGQELGKLASSALSTKPAGAIVEKHSKKSEKLDLYEALVGLSESLSNKHPYLFPPAKKSAASKTGLSPIEKPGVNYYAFNIVTLVAGLKISEVADLRRVLSVESESSELEVSRLFDQVSKAADKVASALDSLAYANVENNVGHSEAGMAALVSALAIHAREGKNLNTVSASTIRRHYVIDLIRGLDAKGHASDLAAFERVWAMDSGKLKSRDFYTAPCEDSVFESALGEFWNRELQRTISPGQMRRPKIDNVQKAILRLYLSQTGVFAVINASDSHHVDHVIPFMRATNWINDEKGTLPIGAISNLAFLPEKLNLSKGSNTLDEWFSNSPKGSEKTVKQQILDTHSKDQIWSLVPAHEGESKELTRLMGPRNVEEQFKILQTRIWDRIRTQLMKL